MSNIKVYNPLTKQTVQKRLIICNTEYNVFNCIIRYVNITEIQIIAVSQIEVVITCLGRCILLHLSQKSKCEFHLPMARLTSGKLINIGCKNMHSTFSDLMFDWMCECWHVLIIAIFLRNSRTKKCYHTNLFKT